MIDNQKLNNDRIVYEQSSTVNDDDITSAMRMEPIYMALSKAISSAMNMMAQITVVMN